MGTLTLMVGMTTAAHISLIGSNAAMLRQMQALGSTETSLKLEKVGWNVLELRATGSLELTLKVFYVFAPVQVCALPVYPAKRSSSLLSSGAQSIATLWLPSTRH
jgi:hypothetical protein